MSQKRIRSSKNVLTRKIMCDRVSKNAYAARTTSVGWCLDVPTSYCVYIAAVFWRHGFVVSREASTVLNMDSRMDVSAQFVWFKSIVISWVWCLWCSCKAINHCARTRNDGMLCGSAVRRRESYLVLLWHVDKQNNAGCAQCSRSLRRRFDGGWLWMVWCLINSADKRSILLGRESYTLRLLTPGFACFQFVRDPRFFFGWGYFSKESWKGGEV